MTATPNLFPSEMRHVQHPERYRMLTANWTFSSETLERLRARLGGTLSTNVDCVAVAGSFGRYEASSSSDLDYILVVNDSAAESVIADKEILGKIIEELGITPPNKSGVFSSPRRRADLLESIGSPDEKIDVLGKRMLLLLESRPIYGDKAYAGLMEEIVVRYAQYISTNPSKEFAFLLNDLIRYFRYICVNYQSSFWRENEKWGLRNLKLRHSRILMYGGLLFVLGEASKFSDERKQAFVREALPLTPLERVAFVYEANADAGIETVLRLYDTFLEGISDPALRSQLNAIEYERRYEVRAFSELKENSDAFVAELMRFVFSRRGVWSDRFYEYLIF